MAKNTLSAKPLKLLVLNIQVVYECDKSILDELEQIKELIETARGYGTPSGTITVNGTLIDEFD